jgi:hypothetical protein
MLRRPHFWQVGAVLIIRPSRPLMLPHRWHGDGRSKGFALRGTSRQASERHA